MLADGSMNLLILTIISILSCSIAWKMANMEIIGVSTWNGKRQKFLKHVWVRSRSDKNGFHQQFIQLLWMLSTNDLTTTDSWENFLNLKILAAFGLTEAIKVFLICKCGEHQHPSILELLNFKWMRTEVCTNRHWKKLLTLWPMLNEALNEALNGALNVCCVLNVRCQWFWMKLEKHC